MNHLRQITPDPNNWQWQIKEAITSFAQLKTHFPQLSLTKSEELALGKRLPLQITPYYLEVIKSEVALQKTLLPSLLELHKAQGEAADPLDEENQSPMAGLVHRYPNRVLLYLTEKCAVYCRYCTRGRKVGKQETNLDFDQALVYIQSKPDINEVILSGGDPLLLSSEDLKSKLKQLFKLQQMQVVRFSTKLPLVLPQKITHKFAQIFSGPKPIYMNLHVLHPAEITEEVAQALGNLRKAGVILSSQTVLLQGVNDDPMVMEELNKKLLSLGVKPYALYHCDPILGGDHFRTSIEAGVKILEHLRKTQGGMALPQFIIDPVGGKVNIGPDNFLSSSEAGYKLKNWQGEEVFYPFQRSK